MADTKSFIEILDNSFDELHKESVSVDRVNKEIDLFESYIPDFFSKNGEANGIKSMYKGIKENMENEYTIKCIDLNKVSSVYEEYMDGMIQFINDINNINIVTEADQIEKYKTNLETAKDNSGIFIESLYDGTYSENKDYVLSEAVTNIECLIDFIPRLKQMRSECNKCSSFVNECADETKKELLSKSAEMMYESVGSYCHSMIKNIVNTYYDINKALDGYTEFKEPTPLQFKLF